jgi:hypothetical protein
MWQISKIKSKSINKISALWARVIVNFQNKFFYFIIILFSQTYFEGKFLKVFFLKILYESKYAFTGLSVASFYI